MSADLYAAWLTAGDNLQPVGAWLAHNWINLAIAASIGTLGIRIIRWSLRDRHHLPAAPDNVPPADIDALITCRRIAALHPADPAMWRQADNYHRQKGDEQP